MRNASKNIYFVGIRKLPVIHQSPYIVIGGPTACGKTALAIEICTQFKGEIISADSRQVYKGMDLGTGKDLSLLHKNNVPYHLIDIIEPTEEYNVFRFQQDFLLAYDAIAGRKKLPVVCGGSGLYIEAAIGIQSYPFVPENPALRHTLEALPTHELITLLHQYRKPHNTTDYTNRQRLIRAIEIETYKKEHPPLPFPIHIKPLIILIKPNKQLLKKNILKRLEDRLQQGMIEEVKNLLEKGVSYEKLHYFGLEYKYIALFLEKKINFNDMKQKLYAAILNFSKRQQTFFKRLEKQPFPLLLIEDIYCKEKIYSKIKEYLTHEN